MGQLFNNGFLVKSLNSGESDILYPPLRDCYRGMGRFISWPLDNYDDDISKALVCEAWDKWFAYQNVFELVPQKEYLKRYIKHCDDLGIQTMTLMVETTLNTQIAEDSLNIIECLGFDLISSVDFSYLAMDTDYLEGPCEIFKQTVYKLNSNGLCDSISDVYAHIQLRNSLLRQGINIEHSDWGPHPARLSIVEIN